MKDLPEHLRQPDLAPVLQILNGQHKGKQFRLLSSQITIGRHNDCDVIFKDDSNCSRHHARIKKEENNYFIESLNPENPVLINNKSITAQILKQKDEVTIGNIKMLFLNQAPVAVPSKKVKLAKKQAPQKKSSLNFFRLILILAFIGGVFLFLSEDNSKKKAKQSLRTESEILEEVEALKNFNEKETEKKILSPQEKAAKTAFIRGFRDYRKGYFHRALKMFQHCLTLYKTTPLCHSYSIKSKVQIDKLVQKKIRLGNNYKKNKQYEACKAAFRSVEIMVQDSKSLIYKEAKANRKLCEIQLENKI